MQSWLVLTSFWCCSSSTKDLVLSWKSTFKLPLCKSIVGREFNMGFTFLSCQKHCIRPSFNLHCHGWLSIDLLQMCLKIYEWVINGEIGFLCSQMIWIHQNPWVAMYMHSCYGMLELPLTVLEGYKLFLAANSPCMKSQNVEGMQILRETDRLS